MIVRLPAPGLALALSLAVAPLPAHAADPLPPQPGVSYRFETTGSASHRQIGDAEKLFTGSGRLWVSGERYRIEVGEAGTEDLFKIFDGKDLLSFIPEDRTYHRGWPVLAGSQLHVQDTANLMDGEVKNARAELTEEEGSPEVDGRPTRKFVLRYSYQVEKDFGSELVTAELQGTAIILTVKGIEGRPRGIDPGHVRTGHEAMDEILEARLAGLEGFPVRQEVSFSTRYPATPPHPGFRTIALSAIENRPLRAELFEVPGGYRYQEPVFIGFDGKRVPLAPPQR